MTAGKTRVGFLATARCIGILLVVLGHSYPFGVPIPAALEQLRLFIYRFHMPLFIFISGYLAGKSTAPAVVYIQKRAKRLLIPYFALSLIAFLPKAMVQQYLNNSVELSFWFLIRSELIPRENIWGHFWYLPMLFFLGCAGVLLAGPMKRRNSVCCAALAVSFALLLCPGTTSWLGLEDIRRNAFYYVLGMAATNRNLQRMLQRPIWLTAVPAALLLKCMQPSVLRDCTIACLMIGAVLSLGTVFDVASCAVFDRIEKNSYVIFLLSWPAQAVAEVVLNKVLHLSVPLTMLCMFTAGLAIPLLCVQVIRLLDRYIPMRWVKTMVGM